MDSVRTAEHESLTSFRTCVSYWMMEWAGTKQRWGRTLSARLLVSLWGALIGRRICHSPPSSSSTQVRLLGSVKMLKWWAYGTVRCKQRGLRVLLWQDKTMVCPGCISGACRSFRDTLHGAQLVFLPVRSDKRDGRCRCGVLNGKKLMRE